MVPFPGATRPIRRKVAANSARDLARRNLQNELRAHLNGPISSTAELIAFEELVGLMAVMRSATAGAADYAKLDAYLLEFGLVLDLINLKHLRTR